MLVLADVSPERLSSVCGDDPGRICRTLLDATDNRTLAELGDWLVGPPLRILLILLVAVVANRIARRAVKRTLRGMASGVMRERLGAVRKRTPNAFLETQETNLRGEQRSNALSGVLRSIVSFVIFAIAGFMVLDELGVNLAPLLAGAGVVGLAIGFGSQALVKDFLSGMFILIEDQFGVGDIVDLDGTSGTVEAISLRTTQLRSVDGTVWHVPNGEIRRVGNMSKHWSRALLDIEVAYGTDIEQARAVIKRVADRLWRSSGDVLEEPEVQGVEALGASGVTIRLLVKTTPSQQWEVSRRLREQIKGAFDDAGIEIPFPQQTVWHRTADEVGAGNGDG
ncbi:mechanosensitive ion channel family protein [Conexibacter sp. CPCC 206217]|uniref:mechanosensitive ion channel family protein n=1 Tax=Conexibacter sp. CPCC 206217 TaxID=3064574 RepID=UPI00271AF6F5|nr:mechanosensitive ion channel family protein [Conexibacter sp. CPCC 206217]MDO8213350.1 mechanosensitive ion channel family protein [Conexibacter sp. CPCC 206217]